MYGEANTCDWAFTCDEWRTLGEFEAVLYVTKITSTLMQYETVLSGAYGYVLKSMTLLQLRSGIIPVINQEAGTSDLVLIRVETTVSKLSLHGQTWLRIVVVEAERRWCGITSEDPIMPDANVIFTYVNHSEKDLISYLLDIRIVNSGLLDQESLSTAFYALGAAYVDCVKRATKFYYDKTVKQWHEEKKKENEKQKGKCGEEVADIRIGNGKVTKKVPKVENSKKAGSFKYWAYPWQI
jgi:hypothetical protein